MANQKKAVKWNLAAFLVLFFVSLYRQISLHFLPDDPVRTYVLYACYVVLMGIWVFSICTRVTQKAMRVCLLLEASVMFAGLTIRFVQDTFLYTNTLLMRVSGLYVCATILPMLFFSFYATLCIGKPDDYHLSKKWYAMMAPVVLMTFLITTDERRHFFFYILPEEKNPNIEFHPNVGIFIILALAIAFMIWRIVVLRRENKKMAQGKFLRWFAPAFEPLLTLLFTADYFLFSLQLIPGLEGIEVIELYARIYYIEVLSWEFNIFIGLVPVNTCYEDVFRNSTVAMQIVDDNGENGIRSQYAEALPPEVFDRLKTDGRFFPKGKDVELHLHPLDSGYFIWKEDTSRLQDTIRALQRSADDLAQEGALLEEEVRTRSDEAKVQAQNRIYDNLVKDVEPQLSLLRAITDKCQAADDKSMLLGALLLVGTYVKRRCNMQLVVRELRVLPEDDLWFSFQDMIKNAGQLNIRAHLDWVPGNNFSSGFSIYAFDILEFLLEYERFTLQTLELRVKDGMVSFSVTPEKADPGKVPQDEIAQRKPADYNAEWQLLPDGYRLLLSERRK